jgi:hypothetical protein
MPPLRRSDDAERQIRANKTKTAGTRSVCRRFAAVDYHQQLKLAKKFDCNRSKTEEKINIA